MSRWLLAAALAVAGTIWLAWAFPRYHAAAEWRWTDDRDQLIARARRFASEHGVEANGWKAYSMLDADPDNALAQKESPRDRILQSFPISSVQVALVPQDGPPVLVTLRPGGRPVSWKLPPPVGPGPSADSRPSIDPRRAAETALAESVGADAPNFRLASNGMASREGVRFTWEWPGPNDGAQSKAEALFANGFVREFENKMTLPKGMGKRVNRFQAFSATALVFLFIALIVAVVFSMLRDGVRVAARALREMAVVRLAGVATVLVIVGLIAGPGLDAAEFGSGLKVQGNVIVGLILGGLITGLTLYAVLAACLLNARFHPRQMRGLALLATKSLFSRPVGEGLLGGMLLGPALVAIPLAAAAIFGLKQSQGIDAEELFSGWPVLSAFYGPINATVLGVFGILVPLAYRWFKRPAFRYIFVGAVCLTFAQAQFAVSNIAVLPNEVSAIAGLILVLWLYKEFGVLGAVTGKMAASAITSAGIYLAQPAAGIQSGGVRILLALGALGVFGLLALRFGPDPKVEVYGFTGLRVNARSRREELQAEFQVARSAQQRMLPSLPPSWPGYTLAASCEPAREVGGDLYDFLRLPDGRWGIGVADVSGKGVPAALYMTLTKGLLAAASQDSNDPREILTSVNRHLHAAARRKVFVTMALGVLDPVANRVEYVRAGHNPVVWRRARAKETRLLAGPGLGLGIAGNSVFQKTITAEHLTLEPGDALVFYSDGLTEAMDDKWEQFGEERLIAAVERCDGLAAEPARQKILEEVKLFLRGTHAQDDLTIAVLRFEGNSKSNSNGRITGGG